MRPASQLYLFSWEAGRISSFVGVHRPESCLPASGWTLDETFAEQSFTPTAGGPSVRLTPYRFTSSFGQSLMVYFGVWDELGGGKRVSARNAQDRLTQALQGQRITGRQSLGIYLLGATSPQDAQPAIERAFAALVPVAHP